MASELRPVVDLSHGWEFLRRKTRPGWAMQWLEPAGDTVDLPHSWNASDTFQQGVTPYRGPGSYRRRFVCPPPPTEGSWVLVAEGFYGTGEVWLNGRRLAKVDGQFMGFRLQCDAMLNPGGENFLGLRLTNRCPNSVLPGFPDPDFILHGGLAGRVFLEWQPATRIARHGARITTELTSGGGALVHVECSLSGLEAAATYRLRWTVRDDAGRDLSHSEAQTVDSSHDSVHTVVELPEASLWSPDTPVLHHAEGELYRGDTLVDRVRLRFGIREAEFRPRQGFFLNGRRVLLKGCNRHESMPGFGQALPAKLQRRDAELLKSMGFNFVRLSHYPQQTAFLDACDELGLLVYAEIATWKSVRCGRWLENAVRQMQDMLERDRNHPSIIIWGLGNESRSRRAYTVLREVVEEMDPGRPVTYAENHSGRARLNRVTGVVDVWGINYELDVIERAFDWGRLENVLICECIPYQAGRRGSERELDHVRTLVATLREIDRHPALAGYALWAFSDYATMHLQRYQRFSGIVDAWRTPKYAALLMQARLAGQPFLRLASAWGEDPAGSESATREVHIFSNCQEVSLLVDGEPVSTVPVELYACCEIPYGGGELRAVAHTADGVAEDRLHAYGPAVALELELESERAARRETIATAVRVVDAHGIQVSSWHGEVRLALTGPARLDSYTTDHRVLVARGEGRCFFTGRGERGKVEIEATGADLEPAREVCRVGTPEERG